MDWQQCPFLSAALREEAEENEWMEVEGVIFFFCAFSSLYSGLLVVGEELC